MDRIEEQILTNQIHIMEALRLLLSDNPSPEKSRMRIDLGSKADQTNEMVNRTFKTRF